MRKLGAALIAALVLSACGSSSGVSANQAQAYTCDQYNTTPTSETDQQHSDHNDAVLMELLKVHGLPANYEELGSLQAEVDAALAVSGCTSGAKLDDLIDWSQVRATN